METLLVVSWRKLISIQVIICRESSLSLFLIQETDDISGDAGGDKRPLANTFDALRKQEREYDCQSDQRNIKTDFELSELFVITAGGGFFEKIILYLPRIQTQTHSL